MISKSLEKALNDQVNAEYYSAYLYLSMSGYMEQTPLKGTAHWLYLQAIEEMTHATHMYQYLLDRGAAPVFPEIQAPPASYAGIHEVFEAVLDHEQKVTASINAIASLAMKEHDHACYQFIMWYVNEQVEEEAKVSDILGTLSFAGTDNGLLFSLDSELAARVFHNPFPTDAKLSILAAGA